MVLSTRIAALIALVVLAVAVFELVRKKRIREEYAVMWLGVTAAFALLLVFDRATSALIRLVGGVNLSSLFFFGGVLFSVLVLLHLTVEISELKRKQNVIIQELGLLGERLERMRERSGPTTRDPGAEADR